MRDMRELFTPDIFMENNLCRQDRCSALPQLRKGSAEARPAVDGDMSAIQDSG
jgi:hypothetical protein